MMKRMIAALFAVMLVFTAALIPASAQATGNPRVVDNADLLSAEEEQALTTRLAGMSDEFGYDVVMVTVPDLNNADFSFRGTVLDYADRYYETHGYSKDGVLVLITLKSEEGYRNITFSTSGKCKRRLNEDEQNQILDNALEYHNPDSGGYYDFMSSLAQGMEKALPLHVEWYKLPLALLIGFVISIIIMLILKGQLKSVRMQHGAKVYTRPGSMHVTASRDTFLYRTVNRTAKPKDNGGGGSRTSSGGVSHGGISRNF